MKKYAISTLLLVFFIVSCSKVPVTGRKQFSLVPDNMINSMSFSQYKSVLQENKVITTGTDAQMVKTVGQKIAGAVTTYLQQNKAGDRVNDFKWEFNLIESKDVNAWCMPGGKVAVYTGILPLTQNETGMAVVMGHEVAHAVARHGSERMSQGLVQQLGAVGLAVALKDKPTQTQALFNQAYGVGTTVGLMLPFSRKHESEADKLGLIFMAMAGYNPQEAVPFWQRMSKAGGPKPPEFLSTHPNDATRVKDIQNFLPTAQKYYKGKTTGGIKPSSTTSGTKSNTSVKSGTGTTSPAKPNTNTNTGGKVKAPSKVKSPKN